MSQTAYINDLEYSFETGDSILNFVTRHKGAAYIPTLCDDPNITPGGSCRLCTVDLSRDGRNKTVASCHTLVQTGDRIYPNAPGIQKLRKNILELVLTDHPPDCLTCSVNGQCTLQSVVAQVGLDRIRYPNGANHQHYPKDESHPYLTSDLSKCINCQLCIRACDEIQGEFVLSMAGRGFDSYIIKDNDTTFIKSSCVACGACAEVCPTSAISDVFAPSRTQADRVTRTVCTYCGVGCNLNVYTLDDEILSISAPADAAANQGHTCVKGKYAFQFYNHKDRLRQPLIKRNGTLEPATWEEAYTLVTEKLQDITKEYGPDAIAGISSARCTNEENYLMQKMMRAVIGTNNIDGCARICHAPTAVGMQRAFGTGAATNSIEDLWKTDCILIIGANPTNAHPVTGAKMKQAAIRGTPMIVADPRKTDLARHADIHLALRPGTNIALLNMMLFYILEEGMEDDEFIRSRCEGYDSFRKSIMTLDMNEMSRICGVSTDLVKKAARLYAQSQRAMCFHGLGVTEHLQGTKAVTLIANLAMITGNIGKPGSGVNPLRGQNNVQGAADMGVQPNQGPGYLNISDARNRKTYEDVYAVVMPGGPGLTIPRMFDAALNGELKALWIMGEDVVQTEPNSGKVIQAIEKLDLLIVQELFMSETSRYADVVFPASSFFEKNGTFTNGERRIQKVQQVIEPIKGTKPDGQIIVDIMNWLGFKQPDYHPGWVLDEIARVVPFFKGVSWSTLGKNGKQWPVEADGKDTQILHTDTFKRGKGKFHFVAFEESPEIVEHSEEFPFILTTNRSLSHYNSGSMTRRTADSVLLSEDLLLINAIDAKKKEIRDNEEVMISSARGFTKIRVKVTDEVKPGILSTTFHFPDILINKITSDVLDTEADCPEYKVVAVNIEPLVSETI